MRQRVKGGTWLAASLTLSLIAGACSPVASPNISASSTAATPTGGSTAPTAPAPSVATTQGGTLSVASTSDIQYFDPAKAYDTISWPAVRLIYETLVTYDSGTTLIPLLASEMPTISAEGKTYTFKLRTGVKFVKPDGSVVREMNADDVVASLNRILNPNLKPSASPVSGAFFGNIAGATEVIEGKSPTASGIKKIDDATVEISLTNADATFLNILATPFASVIPKESSPDTAEFEKEPIGTGPYTLKEYAKGTQATFVANKAYWQPGQPFLDQIDFKVGIEGNAAIQQIQADQLDVFLDPLPSASFTQITTDPKYTEQLFKQTLVATDYLFMDTQQPDNGPFSKKAVRQALQYAIDKDNILKVLHGAGVKADCIFPPDMPGYDPNCKPYDGFDPAKAKQMLSDAGYPNGFETTLYTFTTDPGPLIAQAVQQDLAAVGVKIDIVTEEFATFLDRIGTPHNAPFGFVGWFQDYPDPSDFIDPILSCATAVQGGSNPALYCNKEVDALAAKARGEVDSAKRLEQYRDIQERIMEDAPWIPLDHQVWYTLVSTRVANFALHPNWLYDLRSISVKPGS